MQIKIDNASTRPIYQQIIDQIKRDIALGRLKAADKLPTVRQLAAQLVLNPNTISKAYRQLEQDGIIVTRPGAGAYVAELSSNLSKSVRKKLLCEQIELLVVEAVHMQIDARTLGEWFDGTAKKFKFTDSEE
ncbi:MAG TPA: GntR family transcriptional regulator [Planctomycetes bacterium]|nr:GntR family transcriptional regulator [Planctomycetota bacterium]